MNKQDIDNINFYIYNQLKISKSRNPLRRFTLHISKKSFNFLKEEMELGGRFKDASNLFEYMNAPKIRQSEQVRFVSIPQARLVKGKTVEGFNSSPSITVRFLSTR